MWRATQLLASHYFSVPWSIGLVCSHRNNTGLGTTCRRLGLTCQRVSRKGKPVSNETDQGEMSLSPWSPSKRRESCRNNTAAAEISTVAEHGHRAGSNGWAPTRCPVFEACVYPLVIGRVLPYSRDTTATRRVRRPREGACGQDTITVSSWYSTAFP